MMGMKDNKERTQIEFTSLEDLVPKNHLIRKLNKSIKKKVQQTLKADTFIKEYISRCLRILQIRAVIKMGLSLTLK
ncbi:hypothetical protein [Lacrimispora sp.]|uniref:hypothetical protein n=1 Tax=Lacrimispora sp. TaxID=2719234 RepID=UPI00289CB3E2|nr:hypothetical protein [Lacrimispora sp.]